MQVLVLNSCPVGVRGDVTRWFMEIAPGVYVGNVTARVRDALWERIVEASGRGRVLLIYPATNEQGYVIRSHQYEWTREDFDGIILMMRPYQENDTGQQERSAIPTDLPPKGWSTAARRRSMRRN